MIVPDVNVLVYAYRREAGSHERYASWLAGVIAGADELGLVESALTGFVRIVTNPRIVADPAPTGEALRFVHALRTGQRARCLTATDATWAQLASFARVDPHVRGNLVPDAWLAAMARSHGGRVATADRGFARFPGLDWFDPATAP
ncbi:MAG: TA system VapC family ribonuclease toxin [Pseudonocardia sp.]